MRFASVKPITVVIDEFQEFIKVNPSVFSGFALERYFRESFIESGTWTRLGSWWDRKGENEIDILAENELDGTYAVCEVKRDKSRIDLERVKAKYGAFVKASGKWKRVKPQFLALSIEDM